MTLIAAVKVVAAAGVNVTEIVQVANAASVEPQVFAMIAKSVGLAPVRVMPLMFKVAFPRLESVVLSAVAVEPTAVLGKVRLVGKKTA